MSRRAISPVIATIIIVAVTIAIAIAVAGWLMGLWGSYGAVEQLTVMPDSSLSGSTLTLHVKNTGTKSAVITKVEVVGLATTTTTITVSQGTDTTTTIDLGTATAVPGTQYQIKVYTDSGSVYQGFIVAQ